MIKMNSKILFLYFFLIIFGNVNRDLKDELKVKKVYVTREDIYLKVKMEKCGGK